MIIAKLTSTIKNSMKLTKRNLILHPPSQMKQYLKIQSGNSIKDVIRNRFNFILEERVKFSEQNSENLMKIGWKIRKLWNFEISQIFKKQFLTSRYEYANERVDDVIASQFSIHFVYRNDKNFIFQLRER